LRVFISGIAGFLGAHLARACLEQGWDVAGCDNLLGADGENVPDQARWIPAACQDGVHYRRLLKGCDVVYHCAAAPYEGLSPWSPQIVYEHTLMSTVAMLRESVAAGVRRFVLCSSMSRYGDQKAPFREEAGAWPASPYGWAKVAAEDITRNLCELHGLEWVIVVPHNIYGPGQKYDDPYRNVCGIMINRILSGKPPVVYGDGTQRRSLSYIADVAGPLVAASVSPAADGGVFNVGPDDEASEISMGDLAALILKLCDSDLEPVFFPARPAEVHVATCSGEKARRVLGYQPQWALEDGLREMIAWVRERGPRPFAYHVPVELPSERTPKTWTERLI